jgi:PIN domain nuclease of toxin-antitoxin system
MSAVSWWELGLKCALGKLDANLPEVRHILSLRGVVPISVTLEHGEAAAALAIVHRDPFDHMLVAQALAEGLQLLTRDKILAGYGSAVLYV